MKKATIEETSEVRASLSMIMDPQTLNTYAQRGEDPVIVFYRHQALKLIWEEKL
jgi:hypothetical protein